MIQLDPKKLQELYDIIIQKLINLEYKPEKIDCILRLKGKKSIEYVYCLYGQLTIVKTILAIQKKEPPK